MILKKDNDDPNYRLETSPLDVHKNTSLGMETFINLKPVRRESIQKEQIHFMNGTASLDKFKIIDVRTGLVPWELV